MKPTFDLDVSLEGSDIIITHGREFRAVYYKPAGYPQLIHRERTKCDDHDLLAAVWIAANDKAQKFRMDRVRGDASVGKSLTLDEVRP